MFDTQVTKRNEAIDGVSDWMWVSEDDGTWDGPRMNWVNEFRSAYIQHCRKFDTVIQAGGAMGMYPRLLSQMFKTVYTFEPDPLNFHCLVNNCQSSNIIKINAALGDTHKMVKVNVPCASNRGCNNINTDDFKDAIIPQLMIDDLEPETVDMILLDIEGYEGRALMGGMTTIAAHKPLIVCENGNDYILNMIKHFGYEQVARHYSDTFYAVPKLTA